MIILVGPMTHRTRINKGSHIRAAHILPIWLNRGHQLTGRRKSIHELPPAIVCETGELIVTPSYIPIVLSYMWISSTAIPSRFTAGSELITKRNRSLERPVG